MSATAPTGQMSRFAISDLAIQSAVELEKARVGSTYNIEPLTTLAVVLNRTAEPNGEGAPFKFVEPGFYEPLERIYELNNQMRSNSVEELQSFFTGVARKLNELNAATPQAGEVEILVRLCVHLHRELIRDADLGDGLGRHDWRRPGIDTSVGVS